MITYKWPWKVYNNKNNNDNYEINNNNDNNTANGNNDNNEIKKNYNNNEIKNNDNVRNEIPSKERSEGATNKWIEKENVN